MNIIDGIISAAMILHLLGCMRHLAAYAVGAMQTGVDEAGRGPLAGPVVAGACIISPDVDVDVDIPGDPLSPLLLQEDKLGYCSCLVHAWLACGITRLLADFKV